jgi:hypothetical protein
MTDKEKEKVTYTRPKGDGEVDRRRFAAAMSVAGTVAVIGLVTFFSVGMVGAALGVGIGGFVANFQNVTYNSATASNPSAEIYPTLGAQPACDNAPQIEASLSGDAILQGQVEFFKDLPLPSGFGSNDFARISIVANNGSSNQITATDLNLRLSALETTKLSLSDADIGENSFQNTSNNALVDTSSAGDAYSNETDGAEGAEFAIQASSFELPEGGSAAAHQVSFSSIDLNDLNIFVQILNSANDNTPNGTAERFVGTGERTCQSLASLSQAGQVDENGTASPSGPQLFD